MAPSDGFKAGIRFRQVLADELECVRRRWRAVYGDDQGGREAASGEPTTRNGLVGLAFSGGGIRSATINMGIAQALHRRGVFDHVDYMSTVSGGGYLGSSISTAMRQLPAAGADEPEGKGEFPFPYREPDASAEGPATDTGSAVESPFLTWVRNHSNYLVTGGFLDYVRIFAVLLRGILVNFLVLLPLLLVAAVGLVWWHDDKLVTWEAVDQSLAAASQAATDADKAAAAAEEQSARCCQPGDPAAGEARRRADEAAAEAERLAEKAPRVSGFFKVTLILAGFFGLIVLVFPVFIRVYKIYKHEELVETGSESSVGERGLLEMVFAVSLVGVFAAALVEGLPLLIHWFHGFEHSGGLRGLVAGAGSGGALGVLAASGKALSKLGGLRQKLALLLVGLIGLIIPLVITLYVTEDLIYPVEGIVVGDLQGGDPLPHYQAKPHQPMAFTTPLRGYGPVRLLPGVLLLIMAGGFGAALVGWKWNRPSLARTLVTAIAVVASAFVGYLALWGGSQLLAQLSGLVGFAGIRPDLHVLTMAAVVLFFCWVAVDVNLTSVNGFYRDRLANAYLVGLRKDEDGESEIFVEPDVNLEELCGGAEGRSKAPYHIVNTSLNLQGSKDPMLRDRNSDFLMFSKLYYGGHRTGYCHTGHLEQIFPQMDLPTAMAISAAAASPNAGRMTSKPLVALMTLLNVRLGYWVPHPGRLCKWMEDEGVERFTLKHRWRWRIRPWALLREMISKVDERHWWINLSDGGHIENLATYELLRRRCAFIICGDGEGDPTLTFGGLATLMRAARIDMGIEIEILLDDIRLGADRRSHQHAALGRIRYPPLEKGGAEEEGLLLYIKSSFTGTEDETIQEYRSRNPEFPHQTTADQFFDEGQFEAYRALGFHMADRLFPAAHDGELVTYRKWEEFTAWFRSLSADLAPRLSAKHTALQEQLRQIHELLRAEPYHDYFYELNPKIEHDHGAESDRRRAAPPELLYVVGLQVTLMEEAFLTLDLDQPRNWRHEGNRGWHRLFESWAQSETFRTNYALIADRHSGRFQNFCARNLGLEPPPPEGPQPEPPT